jgi:NAD(P)-dependent dehydrogenase (short-subunit alcohol dehydrogenase family)
VDICAQLESVTYAMSTPEDLEQTVKEVEALGRRIVARQADVRDVTALQKVFDEGATELGPVSIVLANAGIGAGGSTVSAERQWEDVIAVNLTGVWNTGRVAIPAMIERGQGGAIVLTSSTGGLIGVGIPAAGFLGYTAAKHGVIGLMRSWANYLAPHFIRVNSVAPTAVRTPMAGDGDLALVLERNPKLANALSNAMPVDLVEPVDVSNAIAWLVSDDARYVTGTVVPVDAGALNKR